jgi:hypothetical protein
LYDPVVHQPMESDNAEIDQRWIVCKRPCIVVGGELIPSMLELRLDEASGIYAAPLQMKSNNGILIIDDFGRQLMSPRDLLNRWIVPLDRRVDYLTLRYGVKFQIPFELMVVFSTNLEPSDLAELRSDFHPRGAIAQHPIRAGQRGISSQTMPAGRPHRTARVLSGRHLQYSDVDWPLRRARADDDQTGAGTRRGAVFR